MFLKKKNPTISFNTGFVPYNIFKYPIRQDKNETTVIFILT